MTDDIRWQHQCPGLFYFKKEDKLLIAAYNKNHTPPDYPAYYSLSLLSNFRETTSGDISFKDLTELHFHPYSEKQIEKKGNISSLLEFYSVVTKAPGLPKRPRRIFKELLDSLEEIKLFKARTKTDMCPK